MADDTRMSRQSTASTAHSVPLMGPNDSSPTRDDKPLFASSTEQDVDAKAERRGNTPRRPLSPIAIPEDEADAQSLEPNELTIGSIVVGVRTAFEYLGLLIGYTLLHLVLLPVVGAIWIWGGLKLRRAKTSRFTPDDGDWRTIVAVGALVQISIFGPLASLAQPHLLDRHLHSVDKPPFGDWYGSIVYYVVVAFFMERIAYTFYAKCQRRNLEREHGQRHVRWAPLRLRRRSQKVEGELTQLRRDAKMPSTWVLGVLLVVAVIQVTLVRVISASVFDTNEEKVRAYYMVMTAFWVFIFLAASTVMAMGVLVIAFQHRLIVHFSETRKDEDLTDIRDPERVIVWCAVWQGIILREVQASPAAKAMALYGGLLSLLQTLVTVWYLAIQYLYPKATQDVNNFRSASIVMLVYSFTLSMLYCIKTVQMQRAIEAEHRHVATAHHQLQRVTDDVFNGTIDRDRDDLALLEGKTRVVHALDRLLHTADPKARLLNISLDALRWTVVNVGLLFVNAFIFQILYARCTPKATGDTYD